MTDEQIEQIKDLLAKATSAPWRTDEDHDGIAIVGPRNRATRFGVKDEWDIAMIDDDWPDEGQANAALIALAPTIAQALLDSHLREDALREALGGALHEADWMIEMVEGGNETAKQAVRDRLARHRKALAAHPPMGQKCDGCDQPIPFHHHPCPTLAKEFAALPPMDETEVM